jgi:hypothetical protein
MVLPSLLAISAFDKESRGEPTTQAEQDAQIVFWLACQRFMATFSEFAKANGIQPAAQCEASVSRPAIQPKEPA